MAYIAPIHQPSSVRHAIKTYFLSPVEESLVITKSNRLEIYSDSQDGLSLQHSEAIYGRITMLTKFRPAKSSTDHLFVGTDRYMYFSFSWDMTARQFKTEKSFVDQADKSARDSQTGDRCSIDPSGRYICLETYEGVITILPIAQKPGNNNEWEVGNLQEPIPVRVPEMFIKSTAFFEPQLKIKNYSAHIAIVYEDAQRKIRLKIRLVSHTGALRGNIASLELDDDVDSEKPERELELGASHIIPVSSPTCGILIIGETSIAYYEHSNKKYFKRPLKEATIFVAWAGLDRQRFLLADEFGKLYLLMLELDDGSNNVVGWRLDVVGKTSKASVLTYLDAGRVFVGSSLGDSQVVAIKAESIEIIQTLPNIGPILDLTIMDMGSRSTESMNEYSSGQARLVTGSGAFADGSLRSVRSGVGLEDIGQLGEMDNIVELFSLRPQPGAPVDTLIVSFVSATRVFEFIGPDASEIEEVDDFAQFSLDTGTLLATNCGEYFLQVTDATIKLADVSRKLIATWTPENGGAITTVTAHAESVVVCIGGSKLVALDVRGGKLDLIATATQGRQVACIHVPPSNAGICVVGFWGSAEIQILRIADLSILKKETLTADLSIPRSLLLVNLLENDPTLLIAMADGTVLTYSMDTVSYDLSEKRTVVLGSEQASFKPLPRSDNRNLYSVFATCEHSSLIYGSEGRIVYSAVTAQDTTSVCPFDSQAFPGAIAIATKHDLKLAVVDEGRSTHVRSLHVGETVRRIAYSPELKAFGLGTVKRSLKDGVEIVESFFKLADEMKFDILETWPLNSDELVESVMRCQLFDGSDDMAERFVIGTAYIDDDRADAVRGRMIILEVTEDQKLKLVAEEAVKGAVRCLGMLGTKIVAGLIKTVIIYDLYWETPSQPTFIKKASFRTSTAPIDLVVHESTIAVADLMKSLSLLKYTPGINGSPDTLTEIARHFQTIWATACAYIPPVSNLKSQDSMYLESDAEGNLLVLQRDGYSEFEEDRRRLKVVSEMCLGEMVNKIRPIATDTNANTSQSSTDVAMSGTDVNNPSDIPTITPRAFLATVEGSIYLFGLIAPDKLDLLLRLQGEIAALFQSPGGIPFNKYRAFKNGVREAEEPFRFVDGELIDAFLGLSGEMQEKIMSGLGNVADGIGGVNGVRVMVEGLKRLR